MERRKIPVVVLLVYCVLVLSVCTPALADDTDVLGMWYGTFQNQTYLWFTSNFSLNIFEYESELYALLHIPDLLLGPDTIWPVTIAGDTISFGYPPEEGFEGTIEGQLIFGGLYVPSYYPPYFDYITWVAFKYTDQDIMHGPAPGPQCNLPPLYCPGTDEYCSELVQFEPAIGTDYIDYPNGETWEDQYRSFVRRDVMQIIKYAAAKVECKTAGWDYWDFSPIGLLDMSEADGSIPGTSIGYPGHPPGTHEDGRDIDMAYYQLYAPDNFGRPICVNAEDGIFAGHCLEPPYALDKWRTALLVAYLFEHPRTRIIGVDGQAGPILEEALDELVEAQWISQDLRDKIILGYEVIDEGMGWYYYHHGHLHFSIKAVFPGLLLNTWIEPETLNRKSKGKFVTAYIELDLQLADQIDQGSVALIIDGNTMLYAEPDHWEIGDYDENGMIDLMVKFDRQALLEKIGDGQVELTITGSVFDYYFFQGVDTITVFEK